MIVDLTLGLNEIDLFYIRYHELKDVVDRFVVFEATHTFTGLPKDLYFSQWYKRLWYKGLGDNPFNIDPTRIDIFVWDNGSSFAPCTPAYAWARDNTQRGLLGSWIVEHAAPNDDIVFSDMDEIPNATTLRAFLAEQKHINGIWRLEQNLYYLYMNTYASTWCGTKIFKPHMINPNMPMAQQMNSIRYIGDNDVSGTVANGGWHFSSQGGLAKVKEKFRSYAHYEMAAKPDEALLQNLQDATDPFHGTQLETVSIETLPLFVQQNIEYFTQKGYIYGV